MSVQPLRILFPCFLSLAFLIPSASSQEAEDSSQLALPGSLVDFERDIVPIFREKCLECHGPEDAKEDFRIDDSELILDYLEPGDLESSSIWTDYLVTDDPDMRMPPPDHETITPLTGSQLATIRLWIEEGATWPEEAQFSEDEDPAAGAAAESQAEPAQKPLATRIWSFQGLFHPASVHFPIALLTVSAAFVLFSFFRPDTCEPVAFHCLWIGALGAIAASVMGWAFAQNEGYGAGYSFDLQNSSIDRHRWLGIAAGVIAIILLPIARSVCNKGDAGMRALWMFGSVLMVSAVSVAGYQGGELTYGEDHYIEEFERLFPEVIAETVAEQVGDDT